MPRVKDRLRPENYNCLYLILILLLTSKIEYLNFYSKRGYSETVLVEERFTRDRMDLIISKLFQEINREIT